MIVDIRPSDGPLLRAATTLYVKAADAAVKACEKIGLTVPTVVDAQCDAQDAADLVVGWEDCVPVEANLSDATRDAMRRGVSLAMEKMGKLEDGQTELGIEPRDTREQQAHARDLFDRLNGQSSLPLDEGTVTVSVAGHEPVTLTGREFTRAARKATKLTDAEIGELKQTALAGA